MQVPQPPRADITGGSRAAPRRAAAAQLPAPADGRGWLTDLLDRASREGASRCANDRARPREPATAGTRQRRHTIESLNSLSVDIARMIDHDAAAELWDRYKRGERNVFTRRLYTMQGQKTFEEIRKRYRADREFKQTVDRYIGEFERLLDEVSRGDRGQAWRAPISPRTPARSTPCWRTRPAGSANNGKASTKRRDGRA